MKEYLILRGNRLVRINGEHEHLANATTIAKAESRSHPKSEVWIVKQVNCYRNGIAVIENKRIYQPRSRT